MEIILPGVTTPPAASTADISDWDRIADAYAAQAGNHNDLLYQQFRTVLWECLGDLHGCDVLDVGCGHGWLSHACQQASARVVGVDGSAALLQQASARYPSLDLVQHDLATGLPRLDRRFDRIVANMVLMDLPVLDPLLAAIHQVLQPTGRLIATLPHPCFFHYPRQTDPASGQPGRLVSGYLRPAVWRIDSFGGHNHYHRSLTAYAEALRGAGLAITRLYEPAHWLDPAAADAEAWSTLPVFLLIEAGPLS